MSGTYLPSGISQARLRMEAAGRIFTHQRKRERAKSARSRIAPLEQRRDALQTRLRAEIAKGLRLIDMEAAAHRAERLMREQPTELDIAEQVAERHGVTVAEIMGPARGGGVPTARAEIWWRCRTQLGSSYAHLGRLFARDHTTILVAVRKHDRKLKGAAVRSELARLVNGEGADG